MSMKNIFTHYFPGELFLGKSKHRKGAPPRSCTNFLMVRVFNSEHKNFGTAPRGVLPFIVNWGNRIQYLVIVTAHARTIPGYLQTQQNISRAHKLATFH